MPTRLPVEVHLAGSKPKPIAMRPLEVSRNCDEGTSLFHGITGLLYCIFRSDVYVFISPSGMFLMMMSTYRFPFEASRATFRMRTMPLEVGEKGAYPV